MKKTFFGIIFAVAYFLIVYPAFCENYRLVYEEGFENKQPDNLPDSWKTKINRGTSAEFYFDNAEKHNGKYSYKITVKPPGGSIMLYKETNLKGIKPGKKYEVSIWVKAIDLGYSPNFIAPAFRYNYSPERISPAPTLDLMYLLKGERDWKNLTYVTTAPPNGQEMTIDFLMTKGTIWIDDLQIFEVGN